MTGSFTEAGTTAVVSITIYGKRGVSRKIELKGDSTKKEYFKRGGKDKFHVATEDRVYPVTKIRYFVRIFCTNLGVIFDKFLNDFV